MDEVIIKNYLINIPLLPSKVEHLQQRTLTETFAWQVFVNHPYWHDRIQQWEETVDSVWIHQNDNNVSINKLKQFAIKLL